MAKRKTLKELRAEVVKQARRVRQFMTAAQKRGYTFKQEVPYAPPKEATRAELTKTLNRLKKQTPDKLYKQSTYTSPLTGKAVSGMTGRKLERKQAAQKAVKTLHKRRDTSALSTTQPPETTGTVKVKIPKASTIPEETSETRGGVSDSYATVTTVGAEPAYEDELYEDELYGTEPVTVSEGVGETTAKASGIPRKRERAKRVVPFEEYPRAEALIIGALSGTGVELLDSVLAELNAYEPLDRWQEYTREKKAGDVAIAKRQISGAIAQRGTNAVARAIQQHAEEVFDIINTIQYDSKQNRIDGAFTALAVILKGGALTPEESTELESMSHGEY